ncbi:MAG: aquaporin [Pyrinomonadaceae bacterium]|nr:aquaporin [Pyrinomonadaceae bacterium]
MLASLKHHWPEYLIEAWGLGMFMIVACVCAAFIFAPASPLHISGTFPANLLMGLGMGLTAMGVMLSPWGKRSGAHINPSVTLTFYRLGKIKIWDALFYVVAQFIGGTAGVFLSWLILGAMLEAPEVNYVVTIPKEAGIAVAFIAEFIISFGLMIMVLITSNSEKLKNLTPYLAGLLITAYIVFEVKYSGMSMNPARTFASAIVGNIWTGWWLYFVSPPLAMLTAAEVYLFFKGSAAVKCAKLHHHNKQRCVFCNKQRVTATAKSNHPIRV